MKRVILLTLAAILWLSAIAALVFETHLIADLRVPPTWRKEFYSLLTTLVPVVVVIAGEVLWFTKRGRHLGGLIALIGAAMPVALAMWHDFATSSDNGPEMIVGMAVIGFGAFAHMLYDTAIPVKEPEEAWFLF